ncbi:MAG: hypothetical protein ACKOFW_16560 [Planctomycetaceae bacterium]
MELHTAPAGESFTTYNIEVEEDHTYHVGELGTWVHNESTERCLELAREAANGSEEAVEELRGIFSKEPNLRRSIDGQLREIVDGDLLRRIDAPIARRPSVNTSLPNRVTGELPAGQVRTPAENAQARNFFRRNRSAARRWWEERKGREWPSDTTHYEHPRPLADGGDPLFIEPGYGGPNAPHMIPGPDGLTEFQRWGRRGGRPRSN